ncbi:MAG: DUF6473 family protein [Pseudomonadota bacterium]
MTINATFEEEPEEALDYQLTTLAGSRLQVRGPLPCFDEPFIAVLGGNETFGKYVKAPFPSLLAERIDLPVANLGVAHAGLSLFSEEQVLLDIASKAEVTVLQVLGAQNMSNRLYSVHSRRNDRFLGVSPALREIFPNVDFAEINFTGHLISTLRETSTTGFEVLVNELKWAWLQRMKRLLSMIEGEVILLWVSDRAPASAESSETEPHFVDQGMLNQLSDLFDCLVAVQLSCETSLDGKVYQSQDVDAARQMPGQADHQCIAEHLAPMVAEWFEAPNRPLSAVRQHVRVSRSAPGQP